jgi:hypothetical protein
MNRTNPAVELDLLTRRAGTARIAPRALGLSLALSKSCRQLEGTSGSAQFERLNRRRSSPMSTTRRAPTKARLMRLLLIDSARVRGSSTTSSHALHSTNTNPVRPGSSTWCARSSPWRAVAAVPSRQRWIKRGDRSHSTTPIRCSVMSSPLSSTCSNELLVVLTNARLQSVKKLRPSVCTRPDSMHSTQYARMIPSSYCGAACSCDAGRRSAE